MPALTKANARTLVRQWLDDPDGQFWSNTNLDLLISLVLDDLWSELLQVAPGWRSTLDTIATGSISAPGFIDLSSSGPLTARFYRIQSVTRDGREYGEIDPRDVVIEDSAVVVNTSASRSYFVRGEELWLFPLDDSTEEVELRYSGFPASFDGLAEAASVVFPDGYESAYVLEAAGRAMLKGDRENGERLLGMARRSFERALARVSATAAGPATPWLASAPESWGSID